MFKPRPNTGNKRRFPDRNARRAENPPSPEDVLSGLTTIITDRLVNDAIGVCGIPAERMSRSEAGRRKNLPIRRRIIRALDALGPLTPERLRQVVHDDLVEGHHVSSAEITEHYNIVAMATTQASRVNTGIYLGVMLFDGSPAEVFYTGGAGMAAACGIARRADCQALRVLKLMRSEAAGRTTIGAAARALGGASRYRRSAMRATLRKSLLPRGLVREMDPSERRRVPTSEWRDELAAKRSRRIEPAVFQLTDMGRELLNHADWLTEHGADTGHIRSLLASWNFYQRRAGKKVEKPHNRADSEPTTEPPKRPTAKPDDAKARPASKPRPDPPRGAEYHRQWRAKRREALKAADAERERKAIDIALAERRLRLAQDAARAAELRRAKREAKEQAREAARKPPEQEFD